MLPWSSVLGAIARVANDGEQVSLCRMRVQHVVFDVGLPIRPMLNTLWGNAVAAPRTFFSPTNWQAKYTNYQADSHVRDDLGEGGAVRLWIGTVPQRISPLQRGALIHCRQVGKTRGNRKNT
jgi:hypothetical protein